MSALGIDPGVHRMTVELYEKYAAGLPANVDVELIDGVVYDVSPEQHLHVRFVMALNRLLTERYPDHQVLNAGSVRVDDGSLWNPDVYVLNVPPVFEFETYPNASDVLLAVEVSVSTFTRDSQLKWGVYARNGIPEYWLVRPEHFLQRWTNPRVDTEGHPSYADLVKVPLPHGIDSLPGVWEAFENAPGIFDDGEG